MGKKPTETGTKLNTIFRNVGLPLNYIATTQKTAFFVLRNTSMGKKPTETGTKLNTIFRNVGLPLNYIVTTQKTAFFVLTAIKTSNPALKCVC
jgi:hypothetical protein